MKVRALNMDKVIQEADKRSPDHFVIKRTENVALINVNGKYIITDNECCHYFIDELRKHMLDDTVQSIIEISVEFFNEQLEDRQVMEFIIKEKELEEYFDKEMELEEYIQSRYKTHYRINSNYNLLLESIKKLQS